jgi:SAM-dependent methyltransferase
MHPEAFSFLEESLNSVRTMRFSDRTHVLEFGSRNVNGSPRELFTSNVTYLGVDIESGRDVDVVYDAAEINLPDLFDIAICMEVAEHTPRWEEIILNAARHLVNPHGIFIFTAACDPRPPHSAVDGHNMEPREWISDPAFVESGREYYKNIEPDELELVLKGCFSWYAIETHPWGDVYAKATR